MTDLDRLDAPSERRQLTENIVRRYLELDDVSASISDWITTVYMDDDPPLRDLFDFIAIERPLPPLPPLPAEEPWYRTLFAVRRGVR